MNDRFVSLAVAATLLVGSASALKAQQTMASDVRTVSEAARTDVFARTVTIDLDRVPLIDAVQTIASRAGIRIQYRAELLEAVSRPVTLHVTNAPIGTVLERVLSGTRLRAISSVQDMITILRGDDAAADGIVVGTVRNAKTKAPIVGATVLVDGATKGVLTDDGGAFRLTLPAGTHQVTVRAVGFTKHTRSVTIGEGETLTLDAILDVSASVLNEVVVTGTVVATERRAIATPITVITAEDLEKRNITRIEQLFRGEIPNVIALELGTQSYRDDQLGMMTSTKMYTRGQSNFNAYNGGQNPLKTYVDGVELVDASYLGALDPKSIERIEVIAGPQAATIYGSGAMGGVMQIFTKKGSGSRSTDLILNLRYGMLENSISPGLTPAHNNSLNLRGGTGPEFSYSGTLSYNYQGQWRPYLFNRMLAASLGATHVRGPLTITGSVSTSSGRNGTASFGSICCGGVLERQFRESGRYAPTNLASFDSHNQSTSSSQTLSLGIDYRMSPIWQHHLTVGRSQNLFQLVPQAPILATPADTLFQISSSNGQRTTFGYSTTLAPPRAGIFSSTLTLGANGSSGLGVQTSGCLASNVATTFVACGTTSSTAIKASKTLATDSWGGFGSWQLGLFDRLYLTLGLRGERNPTYGRAHKIDWTPTNGIAFTTEMGDLTVKLLGSYGRATRAPAANQRLQVVSTLNGYDISQYVSQFENPELRPERSRGPQGGIEVYYGNRLSFTVNHYSETISDLVQNVRVDSVEVIYLSSNTASYRAQNQYQNVGDLGKAGWEGTASLNVWAFNVKGSYSGNTMRIRRAVAGTALWSLYYPGNIGSLSVTYARGATNVSWTTNYSGATLQQFDTFGFIWIDRYQSRLPMYVDYARSWGQTWSKPGYSRSDLSASHRLSPWATVMLNITNIGDYTQADVAPKQQPTLGRQTLVGVSLRFPRGK